MDGRVLTTMIAESAGLGLLGGVAGSATAYVLLWLIEVGSSILALFGGAIRIPPAIVVDSIIAAGLVGALSGAVSALSAARSNMVDALRMVN